MEVHIKQATKLGYISLPTDGEMIFDGSYPTSKLRRGRVQSDGNVTPTLTANGGGIYKMEICDCKKPGAVVVKMDDGKYYMVRIRKLTPLECYRLMGVKDQDANKMIETCSNTQCYKQAGNSIVVDVLMDMFRNLFDEDEII